MLTPGIYCTIELHIPRKTPSFVVSGRRDHLQRRRAAGRGRGGRRRPHSRRFRWTRDLGKEVEVRDGVKPGDQVILNPPVELAEGSKVQVSPEAAAPTA